MDTIEKTVDEKELEIAKNMIEMHFKILSAIFDSNGGSITIDANILNMADVRFGVTGKVDGDNLILTKVLGESIPSKNMN